MGCPCSSPLGNDAQCCLTSIQHLHEVWVFSLNVSTPLDILWLSSNLLLLTWPSQRCHNWVVLRLKLIRTTIAYLMGLMISPDLYKSDFSLHYAIFSPIGFLTIHIPNFMESSPPNLSNYFPKIRFFLRPGTCKTFGICFTFP